MTDPSRAIQAAFGPIKTATTPCLAVTVGTTPVVLFTDPTSTYTARRIYIANTHATQDLAIFDLDLGVAVGAQTVTTAGGIVVLARSVASFTVVNRRIIIVGSGASTTFNACASDT